MKLSAILEDDENKDNENIVMVPLIWLLQKQRQKYLRDGYEVIPIPEYQETDGWRAYKVIGTFSDDWWIRHNLSIPIWEDFKLTARYACRTETPNSTAGQQMFDRLDNEEKIQGLKYSWYPVTVRYIKGYFREHPDLLKRAKKSLNIDDISREFKNQLEIKY